MRKVRGSHDCTPRENRLWPFVSQWLNELDVIPGHPYPSTASELVDQLNNVLGLDTDVAEIATVRSNGRFKRFHLAQSETVEQVLVQREAVLQMLFQKAVVDHDKGAAATFLANTKDVARAAGNHRDLSDTYTPEELESLTDEQIAALMKKGSSK